MGRVIDGGKSDAYLRSRRGGCLDVGDWYPASPPICEMHIRDQNQSLSFFLLAQIIVYTKVPIWVGSSEKGVLKGWVSLGTCILKRVCSKGGTKEHMHTTISPLTK